ncbi:putative nuclease HARBI1 [Ambystoma mexicanum]|uniref:putative nuclease HARBI1 n=1 Tax=Ambystoma mexicanum TaxID=8296 RepID=UPI0037E7256B
MIPQAVAIQALEDMPALLLLELAVNQGMQRRRRRRKRVRPGQHIPPVQAVVPHRQPPIPCIRASPFDVSPVPIHILYRLDRDTITTILDLIYDVMVSLINIRTAIPPLLKVVSVIHFLTTGTYQYTVGQLHSISQPCFSRGLNQVLDALLKHGRANISLPWTADEVNATKIAFYALAGMPNVIGVLDCTHVKLVVRHPVEVVYHNRKLYHSLTVQMVCDASKIIAHCCARYPGSTHDAMVLQNSTLPCYMERHAAQRAWLLGDSGYPLKPWLLTPVRNPQNRHKEDYNCSHSRTSADITQTFGTSKARFHCLSRLGGALRYRHEKVAKIIMACVELHNMCICRNMPLPHDIELLPPGDDEGEEEDVAGHHRGGDAQEGLTVCKSVIAEYL